MMKFWLSILLICASVTYTEAQINYVHNGSLEDHWRCPYDFDQIKFANYWTAIDSTNHPAVGDTFGNPNCTPEYSNSCDVGGAGGVPSGFYFYHYARTGDGMAEVMMYFTDTSDLTFPYKRDYLQGRLKNTLIAGTQYCVTFYTVLEQYSTYACNNIGAYLDDGTIDTTGNCGLPQSTHVPQVNETSIITDTLNWTKVQGVFTANGTEKFITIGNFFDDAHTDTILGPGTTDLHRVALYLIDDVSVIPLDAVANAGPDVTTVVGDSVWIGTNDGYVPCRWYTTAGVLIDSNNAGIYVHPTATTSYVMELEVCGMYSYDTVKVTMWPVGFSDVRSPGNLKVYPNPTQSEVTVSGIDGQCIYRLLNPMGQSVASGVLKKDKDSITMGDLMPGIYLLELTSAEGVRTNVRVVKE